MKFIIFSSDFNNKLPKEYLQLLEQYNFKNEKYHNKKCYFIELKNLEELKQLNDIFENYFLNIKKNRYYQKYSGLLLNFFEEFGRIEIYDDYRE